MDFVTGKLAGWLLSPGTLLVLLLVAALVTGGRAGRVLKGLALAALLALALPVGALLLRPLEARFPRPALPDAVDGVVVLGGAVRPALALARDEAATNEHAERLHAGLALARRYPGVPLVHTGGSARLVPGGPTEAAVAARWYEEAGLEPGRLVLEGRSRTTHENAVLTAALLGPAARGRWLLVTSAFHMPRAVAAFRAAGLDPIPWPVDHQTGPPLWPPGLPSVAGNLAALELAAHEWAGLVAYRLTGRTAELLPAP
jgi:uncharacterized SAM-binding protein YcdF (DUF218 family)